MVTFVIMTVRGLYGQIGGQDGQEVAVAFALASQGVRERSADGSVFVANQQVNVGDFVSVTNQSFSNEHTHLTSPRNRGFVFETIPKTNGQIAALGLVCQHEACPPELWRRWVPRDRIELSTPASSGLRSTTELPRLI